jgi:hypothetical protein
VLYVYFYEPKCYFLRVRELALRPAHPSPPSDLTTQTSDWKMRKPLGGAHLNQVALFECGESRPSFAPRDLSPLSRLSPFHLRTSPPTQPRLPASALAQGLRNCPAQSRLPRQRSPMAWATDHPQSRRPSPSRLPCRRSPVAVLASPTTAHAVPGNHARS